MSSSEMINVLANAVGRNDRNSFPVHVPRVSQGTCSQASMGVMYQLYKLVPAAGFPVCELATAPPFSADPVTIPEGSNPAPLLLARGPVFLVLRPELPALITRTVSITRAVCSLQRK